VAPGANEILRSSIRFAEVRRDTRCAPTLHANCQGSLPLTAKLYRSCIGLGWLAQETTGLDWFGPPRSNTLGPVSSCCVPELGVFVVGVTNLSGEGVRPKSLQNGIRSIGGLTLVTVGAQGGSGKEVQFSVARMSRRASLSVKTH
jgi:hypothetical protein